MLAFYHILQIFWRLGKSSNVNGLIFSINMFNEKYLLVVEHVLKILLELKIDDKLFNIITNKAVKSFENWVFAESNKQAFNKLNSEIYTNKFTKEQWIEAFKNITIQDVNYTLEKLQTKSFASKYLQFFVCGKSSKTYANNILNTLNNFLFKSGYDNTLIERSCMLRSAYNRVELKNTQKNTKIEFSTNNNSSVVIIYIQPKKQDISVLAKIKLLNDLLATEFYNELRTKQQLGYLVKISYIRYYNLSGLSFCIESARFSAYEIRDAIEKFIVDFVDKLQNLSIDKFFSYKSSVIDSSVGSVDSQFYWTRIQDEKFDFSGHEKLEAELIDLQLADIIEFFKTHILDVNNSARVSVIGHGNIKNDYFTSLN